jgi:hypothetical protein
MIPTTSWEPTPSDIAWQRSWLEIMANGAVWGVPTSTSSFKFDKINKTFCLIIGDPTHETNRRIAKVLKIIGYDEVSHTEDTHARDD